MESVKIDYDVTELEKVKKELEEVKKKYRDLLQYTKTRRVINSL